MALLIADASTVPGELQVALERLMTGLQQHPPPINYPARQGIGDDLALLTAAIETGQRRHPSPAPTETLIPQFWERFHRR
jgi:hypothetical protein